MVAAVFLPLNALMIMLPLLGLVLNGTSSVLYGVVPELAAAGRRGAREHAETQRLPRGVPASIPASWSPR